MLSHRDVGKEVDGSLLLQVFKEWKLGEGQKASGAKNSQNLELLNGKELANGNRNPENRVVDKPIAPSPKRIQKI